MPSGRLLKISRSGSMKLNTFTSKATSIKTFSQKPVYLKTFDLNLVQYAVTKFRVYFFAQLLQLSTPSRLQGAMS